MLFSTNSSSISLLAGFAAHLLLRVRSGIRDICSRTIWWNTRHPSAKYGVGWGVHCDRCMIGRYRDKIVVNPSGGTWAAAAPEEGWQQALDQRRRRCTCPLSRSPHPVASPAARSPRPADMVTPAVSTCDERQSLPLVMQRGATAAGCG